MRNEHSFVFQSHATLRAGHNCGLRKRNAPPPVAPRSRAQVQPAELALQNRLATIGAGGGRIEQSQSWTATFVGRFCSDH